MIDINELTLVIKKHQPEFAPVVPFNPPTDKLLTLDFTENNKDITDKVLSDTNLFSDYISNKIKMPVAGMVLVVMQSIVPCIAEVSISIPLMEKSREDYILVSIYGAK
jgi:hypothetical protein